MSEDDPWADRIDFLMEVMVSTYERRRFQTEVINELPLYPTESILWDENQVPDVHYTGTPHVFVTEALVDMLGCNMLSINSDAAGALPCPALPCPALPCPALPCPALQFQSQSS